MFVMKLSACWFVAFDLRVCVCVYVIIAVKAKAFSSSSLSGLEEEAYSNNLVPRRWLCIRVLSGSYRLCFRVHAHVREMVAVVIYTDSLIVCGHPNLWNVRSAFCDFEMIMEERHKPHDHVNWCFLILVDFNSQDVPNVRSESLIICSY